MNADIDQFGLFSVHYLQRNLQAAFLMGPTVQLNPFRLGYSPEGLSLLLTLPILVFVIFPKAKARLNLPLWTAVALCGGRPY